MRTETETPEIQLLEMNLYRIIVLHGAYRDEHISTETYLVAENQNDVAEWINKKYCDDIWFDKEDESDVYEDDDGNECSKKDWILANRGDIDDENGWDDAQYGVTKWGWKLVPVSCSDDLKVLLKLNIATKTTK